MYFELYKTSLGDFAIRIKAANGNILARSKDYSRKADAVNVVERIKSDAATAEVRDEA